MTLIPSANFETRRGVNKLSDYVSAELNFETLR